MDENKLFDDWSELKKCLNSKVHFPRISEGDVWWCSMGKNIGVEINGKNEKFSRPVIVFKKLSVFGFLAVPMSTQKHSGPWYVPLTFHSRDQVAVLSQIRIISVARLYKRFGSLSKRDFQLVRDGFKKLYIKE